LFVGPPGAGKSMLARRMPAIAPPPTLEERLEITRVLSAAGRWPGGLVRARPFRAPHHSTSIAGLVGGGTPPSAGEISLAHCGVLFLDELPEFKRSALEALRQPLESGSVWISRAGRQVELKARFQLVCAMNPCPCGYRGHARIPCRCPPSAVQRYRHRISGPLLDRIDLRVELECPDVSELASNAPAQGRSHAQWSELVCAANKRMCARQLELPNARLDGAALDRFVPWNAETRRLIKRAVSLHGLSARAIQSVRRVARTLADLSGETSPTPAHVARALGLRATLS
jgi:magnesium chelatase family protein